MTITFPFPTLHHNGQLTTAWESLDWLPTPQWLVNACEQACRSGSIDGLSDTFEGMGTPALDLLVTPLSARIGALAASKGAAFFHHELRGRLPVSEELAPERHVWDGPLVPIWDNGVLTEPKYFSFFLDGTISPYNPNYRRKWRAHELLHGLVGFYWHPQMTRFGCYLGARLDELLPVVHWYGLDEVFRPRCEKHIGASFARHLCAECESLAVPYSSLQAEQLDTLREASLRWVEGAWEHLRSEWSACLQEWDSGQTVATPRGHLNASSDAIGYVMSHWPRMTAWSFGSWCEMFMRDGLDYYSEHDLMMKVMARTLHRIVSGDISISQETMVARRMKRVVQDIGYRTLLALEWLEEGTSQAERAEDALMPILERGSALAQDTDILRAEADSWCERLFATFAELTTSCDALPTVLGQHFPMLGLQWACSLSDGSVSSYPPVQPTVSIALCEEGLASAAPNTAKLLPSGQWPGLQEWVASPAFRAPGRLLSRYTSWCVQQYDGDYEGESPSWLGWLQFESWLGEEPRQDHDALMFATLPEPVTSLGRLRGTLRLHRTFREFACPGHVAQEVLGVQVDEPTIPLAAVFHGVDPSLLWMEPDMQEVVSFVREERPVKEWMNAKYAQACELLFTHAFLVWMPAPKQ